MNIRGWMDENQNLVAVIAVVIMILALLFIFMQCKGRTATAGSGKAWYFDVAAGTTFADDATLIPPITSPAGNEAVRVHFYSCGDCNESERFVGYYERYTPEVKAKLEAARTSNQPDQYYEMEGEGLLISLDAKQWFPMYSPQAEESLSSKLQCPGGKRLRYCHAK